MQGEYAQNDRESGTRNRTKPEVVIFEADQKESDLWGREWGLANSIRYNVSDASQCSFMSFQE